MSLQTAPSARPAGSEDVGGGESGRRHSTTRHVAVVLLLGVLLGVAVTAVAGVGSAAVPPGQFQTDDEADNTTGPEVGTLAKVNDTAVALEIVDETGVDEDTIDSRDFLLNTGRIANVTATGDGSNATALIELGAPLNTDELTVYVPAGATIEDDDGNGLNEPTDVARTIDGMDGTAPLVMGYRARRSGDGGIDVRIETDDPVASLHVNVTGPESHDLRRADFARAGGNVYESTVTVGADGEYTVELVELTDPHGNWDWLGQEQTVSVDHGPPEAVATVDLAATDGRNYTFDAGRSTDASPIANVTWAFDNGERARGERVTHRFEPGNYTVTARVTDVHGNTGTDDVYVTVGTGNASARAGTAGNASATVRLAGGSDDGSSAMVQVADARPDRAVRIPAIAGRPIAETATVSLDALSVTTARNASYRLGVQASTAASVRDVEAATGGTAVAGLRLVHEVPDASVAAANLTLTVDGSAIADAGGEPTDVQVYRHHDGEWQALETSIEGRDDGSVRYRAASPGLSRFAVAVGGDGATATGEGSDGESGTAQSSPTTGTTTSDGDGDGSTGSSAGLLAFLPLGLLEFVVRYVGGLVVAGFLLLKSLALAMGY